MATLNKSISVVFPVEDYDEKLDNKLRDFLIEKGNTQTTKDHGNYYVITEYSAENLSESWTKLQAEIEEMFPELEADFDESQDDEPWQDPNGTTQALEITLK